MKVRCLFNQVSQVAELERDFVKDSLHLDEVDLKVGRDYDVFGLAFREGVPWFYILEDDADITSLRLHFSSFFKVIDPIIYGEWQYCSDGHSEHGVAILPKIWASSPGIYESLIDESTEALTIFCQLHNIKP